MAILNTVIYDNKIYDNNKNIEISEINNIKGITEKILNKTLKQLSDEGIIVFPETIKDSEDLSDEQKILWYKDKEHYQSGNVMGFLGYGNERLIICSRFSKGHDEDLFFRYLLSKILDNPMIIDFKTDTEKKDEMFENLLLFIFPHYLKKAMRNGLYKIYKRNFYNDMNLKGNIDVARHIKLNTPFVGKIAYSQREFSFDNHVNQLIRHTIEYIKHKPYGDRLLLIAKDEVKQISEVTSFFRHHDREKIVDRNIRNLVRHPFYKDYLILQKLCISILKNKKYDIGFGNKHIYGILFDGAWLWEEYIDRLINEWYYHPENRKGKGKQNIFEKKIGKAGEMYPDFISKKNFRSIIADAKYKPRTNICREDYNQILAYMYRFESDIGLFLYPEIENESEEKFYLLKGNSYEKNEEKRSDTFVIKQGFNIPKEFADYNDFENKMKTEEENFKGKIKELLHIEN